MNYKLFKDHWKEELMAIVASSVLFFSLTPSTEAATTHDLNVGSTGSQVVLLQQDLNLVDNAHLTLDGDFGNFTKVIVEQFQASQGLTPDGIVGPQTQHALTTQALIKESESHIGLKYAWGGTSPVSGFYCSGFMQYAFGQQKISLPRVSADQAKVGTTVSYSNIKPGDLMFWDLDGTGTVNHVTMYIGKSDSDRGRFFDTR
ncbi:MAG: NlpC/P60 family protein [Desulfosporosinus sp.]|nr:NlpC/P60 family protein [Desulfosporosinus sp.]